jgi:DNA-binding transcriptional LysR family regulator
LPVLADGKDVMRGRRGLAANLRSAAEDVDPVAHGRGAQAMSRRRQVGQGFPAIGRWVVAVLTAPVGLAMTMVDHADVRLIKLPFNLPKIDLNMQWHERVHRDPGGKWMRDAFARRYRAKQPI